MSSQSSTTTEPEIVDELVRFYGDYCQEEIKEVVTGDKTEVCIDIANDLERCDIDLARDLTDRYTDSFSKI